MRGDSCTCKSNRLQNGSRQKRLQEHSVSTIESKTAVRGRASRIKQEPCKLTSDNKILPLLGIPYFTMIMAKSQINPPHQLIVPASFKRSLPNDTVKVLLACKGKTWEMKYCGCSTLKRFSSGWRKFARENNLKIGDGCVFELVDKKALKFRVQILNGQTPDLLEVGSFDRPIYID